MIDHDAVAVDAERSCPNDAAVIRGLDADMLGNREIIAQMHLLINLFAMIDIAAHVSEGGLGLGVRLAREGLMPKESIGGLEAQVGESLVVGLAHLGVDLDEALDGIASAVGIEFAQDLLHELIGDLYLVLGVDGLFLLREDDGQRRRHVIAGCVRSVGQRRRAGRHVPGKGEQREETGLTAGHRPRTEGLVADPDARGCVGAGDVHRGQIGHAEVQVVLVGVRTDERRLSDHVDLALPASGAMEQAAGRRFKNQAGGAIMQLGCGLDADLEVEGGVGVFRGSGSLPYLILCAVLRQGGGELADAVGIVNMDGDRRRLPDGGQGWEHIQRWLAAAGESQK